ncbi:MAG: hypothetical protein LUD52_04630 [Opitutae bacterium]|nr:hypothetical protein [Opitutae bacterium]
MPQQTDNNDAMPHNEGGSDGATVADKLRERERERERIFAGATSFVEVSI